MNLAGPRARDVLARLTDLDVSARRAAATSTRARATWPGVPAILLRIGFVGELAYELHVPADQAAHLWDALMAAGAEFGIRPFGVEAQRVLRLEKQHAIVGQDTDALSDPRGAGMGWLVKADRPDFIGRDAIAALARARPARRPDRLRDDRDGRPGRGCGGRPRRPADRPGDEQQVEPDARQGDRAGLAARPRTPSRTDRSPSGWAPGARASTAPGGRAHRRRSTTRPASGCDRDRPERRPRRPPERARGRPRRARCALGRRRCPLARCATATRRRRRRRGDWRRPGRDRSARRGGSCAGRARSRSPAGLATGVAAGDGRAIGARATLHGSAGDGLAPRPGRGLLLGSVGRSALAAAAAGSVSDDVSVIEMTGARTSLRLAGPAAPAILAELCPADTTPATWLQATWSRRRSRGPRHSSRATTRLLTSATRSWSRATRRATCGMPSATSARRTA